MFQSILRNTQGGTAHHIFKILFRQLGSAEEPFSQYEKNFRETGTLSWPQSSKRGQYKKIVSEYDQEIPQSQTADNPVAPLGRAAQPSRDTRKTNQAKQPALSSPSR